jgi:hypothetical protein
MLDAPISAPVMAEMLFLGGLSADDITEDHVLRTWMGRILETWKVRPCCAPTNLSAVRDDLSRLCRGERPKGVPHTSYADLEAGFVNSAAV